MTDFEKKPDDYLKSAEMSVEGNYNMVGDGIINNIPSKHEDRFDMSPSDSIGDEKRMIQGYEVKNAIHIGSKEIILAEDKTSDNPYMVCNCHWDNPLGIDIYDNAEGSADYLEILTEFLARVTAQVQQIQAQRAERGVSSKPLTAADCIQGSKHANYENQLVVIKPERMSAFARTADQQLLWATHGNGCSPDARGQAVFCKDLFTGKSIRWERVDVAGIVLPERTPMWAFQKLQEMGVTLVNVQPFRDCAQSIDKAIRDCYTGDYRYDFASALNSVTTQHGAERVQLVLANTLQCKDYDGRFSSTNKQWAQGTQLPPLSKESRTSFVCETHPAILDGFLNAVRKQQEKKPSVTAQLKTQHKPHSTKKKAATHEQER